MNGGQSGNYTSNGRVPVEVRSYMSVSNQMATKDEPKAPIAQAECSDTDYDTARSACRPQSIDKTKTSEPLERRYWRGKQGLFFF